METKPVNQRKGMPTLPLTTKDYVVREDNVASHDLVDLVGSLWNLRIEYRSYVTFINFSD